jgi:uncharacterized protein
MKALIVILLLAAASNAQDALQYVKEGDAAYLAKYYAKAVQSYIQAIKLDPESPELYERLGEVYRDQHNQRFIAAFKRAEELRAKRTAAAAPQAPAAVTAPPELAAAKAAHASGDYAAALKAFRPLAEQGNATAQFALGLMYETGQGVPADLPQALAWYEKAVQQKHPQALNNLAYFYAEGQGVPRDLERARKLYSEAASLGVAGAMYSIGSMDYAGEGGPKDLISAYVWWKRAADQHHAKAAANIATLDAQMTAEQLRQARQRLSEAAAGQVAKP